MQQKAGVGFLWTADKGLGVCVCVLGGASPSTVCDTPHRGALQLNGQLRKEEETGCLH